MPKGGTKIPDTEIKAFEDRVKTYSEGMNHIAVGKAFYCKRLLTLAQVMNAENAKSKEFKGCVIVETEDKPTKYDGGVYFHKMMGVAQSLLNTDHENDTPEPEWSGEGLPTVGVECEYISRAGINYKWCKIKHKGQKYILVGTKNNSELCLNIRTTNFRPLQSEREKVIEKALQIYSVNKCCPVMANKLYNAGMLKMPEQNK